MHSMYICVVYEDGLFLSLLFALSLLSQMISCNPMYMVFFLSVADDDMQITAVGEFAGTLCY